jgi:hypothetical protein
MEKEKETKEDLMQNPDMEDAEKKKKKKKKKSKKDDKGTVANAGEKKKDDANALDLK